MARKRILNAGLTGNVNEAELNNNTELLNYEEENVFKNDFQDEGNNEKENLYEEFENSKFQCCK